MNRFPRWQRTLLKALVALLFVVMLFRWFEYKQVYHPSPEMDASAADLGRPFQEVAFKARDGVDLNAWFFPANTNSARAGRVILLCHGNGGNISHRLDLYQALLETGVGLLAFDYRGYGRSGGRPGEEGTYLDAQAAWGWLRSHGFSGSNILAYGESLGGGVATELCIREEIGGLILQSTFTSIPDLGVELFPWLPVRLVSTIRYNTAAKLPRLKVPVLVMHSRGDGMIGYAHSQKNFAAAKEPKLFCELRGEHNDYLEDRSAFIAGIEQFLALVERRNC